MSLQYEELLSLPDAARYVEKRTGRRPHVSSIFRQARNGIRAASGERLCLEHVRVGKRLYTSGPALERYWERLAEADQEDSTSEARPKTTARGSRRDREHDRAEAELEQEGIA